MTLNVTVIPQATDVNPTVPPKPVVLVLGSGLTAKALSQALAIAGLHTVLAANWTQVRVMSGFLVPDLLLLVPATADELAWRACFRPETPDLTISRHPGIAGLRWPIRWRTLVTAVRHRIEHGPALAILRQEGRHSDRPGERQEDFSAKP